MRRTALALVLAFLAALLVAAPPAATAAETTVDGRGVVDRLWFANQQERLVVRVFAPGGRCRIDSVSVRFRDRDGTRYRLSGFCVSEDPRDWRTRLTRRGRTVDCDQMRLVYRPSGEFWRGVVNRSCLRRLGNTVRVDRATVDTGDDVGRAGPTRFVARG
jgi:hypothetical protein